MLCFFDDMTSFILAVAIVAFFPPFSFFPLAPPTASGADELEEADDDDSDEGAAAAEAEDEGDAPEGAATNASITA